MTWITSHFALLFGGAAGTAVAFLGWYLKRVFDAKQEPENDITESAIASGVGNSQRVNSHDISTVNFSGVSSPSLVLRSEEWKALQTEITVAIESMVYEIRPMSSIVHVDAKMLPMGGALHGKDAIRNKLHIADALVAGQFEKDFDELVAYAFGRQAGHARPNEWNYNMRAEALKLKLRALAVADLKHHSGV